MRASMPAVLVVIVACGGSDSGPPAINASATNVCTELATVACFNLYQCCTESQIESFLDVSDPRTQDQCVDDVSRACAQRVAVVDASLASGRVQFDADAMNTCLKALLAPAGQCATEEMALPWTSACMTAAWTGTVPAGSACDFSFECADDGTCESEICAARPAEGSACPQEICAPGLFCNATQICTSLGSAGATCTTDGQCGSDLFCDTTAVPEVCTAVKTAGEACTSDDACTSRNCLPGTCMGGTEQEQCFGSANCEGYCATGGNPCTTDENCGEGSCSLTGDECFEQLECTDEGDGSGSGSGSNTCVFPNKCLPATCVGNIVCGDEILVVNYCTGALQNLPNPPTD